MFLLVVFNDSNGCFRSAADLIYDKEVDTHIFTMNIHRNQVPETWTRYVPHELFDSR